MKHTGESTEGLRKINDLVRLIAIGLLLIHIYYYCYHWFYEQGISHEMTDNFLGKLSQSTLFSNIHYSKMLVYGLLIMTSLGMGAKKKRKLNLLQDISLFLLGTTLFFANIIVLNMDQLNGEEKMMSYSSLVFLSYMMVMITTSRLPRHMKIPSLDEDVFNDEGESFPQETAYKENAYSIHYRIKFRYKKKLRKGWINVVNPFRAMLVLGIQGSGKTYSIINEAIRQLISKGFTMAIYDYKFNDMSLLAYNTLLKYKHKFKANIAFYVIDFDAPNHSHRCNPLLPDMMEDFSDAVESAKGILLNLNKTWITKQGEFFVEAPVNYLAGVIWYLKLYEEGKYCTLPHVIEMVSAPIHDVIPLLYCEPELETVLSPFFSSLESNAMEQLEGMVDSARIPISRLASKRVYYIMSGNEFSLDINDPEAPKFVCFGNHDDRREFYGALLGLYFQRMIRLINKKNQHPTGVVFDELPTVYVRGLDNLMATARSNKIATILGLQDIPQLERDYGQKVAEAMFSIVGNIFCGQVMFHTADKVSRLFGKIKQPRVSVTQNEENTSFNTSSQMDSVIPASKLSTLSQGEMAGIVADSIQQRGKLKFFKGSILHNDKKLSKEEKAFKPIPEIRNIAEEALTENFYAIKEAIKALIEKEKAKIRSMSSD